MYAQAKNLRRKLQDGDVLFGVFCKTTAPEMIECIGHAGFDFCILDQEHGPVGMETLQGLTRAAELSGVAPIVRVGSIDEVGVSHPLDLGVAGVQVPQINTLDAAKRVIELARFAPLGKRGVCRFVRAANFSSTKREEYFAQANESLIVLQLEASALKDYEQIVCLPEVDVFFIGPYDISQSLGRTGQIESPEVQAVIKSIISLIKANNKAVGIFCDTIEQARKWISAGCQYIAYSVDYGLFLDSCKDVVTNLRAVANCA